MESKAEGSRSLLEFGKSNSAAEVKLSRVDKYFVALGKHRRQVNGATCLPVGKWKAGRITALASTREALHIAEEALTDAELAQHVSADKAKHRAAIKRAAAVAVSFSAMFAGGVA